MYKLFYFTQNFIHHEINTINSIDWAHELYVYLTCPVYFSRCLICLQFFFWLVFTCFSFAIHIIELKNCFRHLVGQNTYAKCVCQPMFYFRWKRETHSMFVLRYFFIATAVVIIVFPCFHCFSASVLDHSGDPRTLYTMCSMRFNTH